MAIAQENPMEKLGRIKGEVLRIQTDIQRKNDTISTLKAQIELLENQVFISKSQIHGRKITFPATVKMDGKVRSSNDPFSDILANVYKGDTVRLTGYQDGYWITSKNNLLGYLSELYITDTDETKILKKELQKQYESQRDSVRKATPKDYELSDRERQAIKEKFEQEIKEAVIEKYGHITAQQLFSHFYWIGMTSDMAQISLGTPTTINRSVGSWGKNEQWVYENLYLYFENGKLTSYQKSK
ncbi:SH3 domain-containing protein [Dyadobacter bucti]|uniref:SH3 domain-containing protein n=1 Tax=Dyadobacter bucti TaxID=2572203 RepID=UPI0011091850|nr:SH3 domain-containing protein [Dyadobacter bucti]